MAYTATAVTHDRPNNIILEAEAIENGFVLRVARHPGELAKSYYCEDEAAIGRRIIALAAEKKMQGDEPEQLELDLGITTNVTGSTLMAQK